MPIMFSPEDLERNNLFMKKDQLGTSEMETLKSIKYLVN